MFSRDELQIFFELAPQETQVVSVLQSQLAAAMAAGPEAPYPDVAARVLHAELQTALAALRTAMDAAGGETPPQTGRARDEADRARTRPSPCRRPVPQIPHGGKRRGARPDCRQPGRHGRHF